MKILLGLVTIIFLDFTWAKDCSDAFFITNLKNSLSIKKKYSSEARLYKREFEKKIPELFDRLLICQKANYSKMKTKSVLEFLLEIRGEGNLNINAVLNRLYKVSPSQLVSVLQEYEKKDGEYLLRQLNFSWENANPKKKKPKTLIELNKKFLGE